MLRHVFLCHYLSNHIALIISSSKQRGVAKMTLDKQYFDHLRSLEDNDVRFQVANGLLAKKVTAKA
jgi:hypothetical protein